MRKKIKEKNNKKTLKDEEVFVLSEKDKVKILLKGSYISEEDVLEAERKTETIEDGVLSYFLSKNILTKDLLGQAIAEYFNVSYADLNSLMPPVNQILKIPKEVAIDNRLVLFKLDKEKAVLSTDQPQKLKNINPFKKFLKVKKVELAYSLSDDIDKVLFNYREPLKERFSKIIDSQENIAPNIIEEIVEDALIFGASDIHFEPYKDDVVVRLRVDGVLQVAGRLPLVNYENILNRIKVQANMSIDEHFSTQDGSIRMDLKGKTVDMRVSIIPTITGEKIVIRMLSRYVKDYFLNDLGLNTYNKNLLIESSKKPFGMILVTGPTGSGKTTTLYSLLKVLHQPGVNITTIEDPVEYRIMGVNQIQVNKKTDLTFSKGLRSIVRQDPDIILVGEIRDEETAEIAVNAALTGHLLLSTFHANDSATTVPRLLDMGVEPFLLSSTLELVIAQRLTRRICDQCRYSKTITKKEINKKYPGLGRYFNKNKINIYEGKGCSSCNYTGYSGRVAIFEFLKADKELRDLILKNPSSDEIKKIARKNGFKSLFEDGIEKVESGQTTIEELIRIAKPD